MPVLPRGPALRQHAASVPKRTRYVKEGGGRGAFAHKTYVGNLDDRYIAFLVEARHGKSREPQNLLYFRQVFGNPMYESAGIGVIVVLGARAIPIVYGLVGQDPCGSS